MPLQPGSIVEGRYRVDRLLGQGGMGAVYRAWDQRLEQWVALKENIMTSAEAQAQFEREAKVLARLRHNNLPRVIDHFVTQSGLQYLVMDYVDGPDLAQLLKARGRLEPADIHQWLSQACDALAYLHSQSPPVIHRDIKPQNVKIAADGRAMLVDFGLSKVGAGQERTATGALGVTPGFSPPEQYGAGHTDQRSDIYALAATLYALLTGETPPDSVQRAIQNAALVPPRRLNPSLSPELEGALMHGLATQPVRRPATVKEFEAEVQQALRSAAGNLAPPTVIVSRVAADVPARPSTGTSRPSSAPRPPTVPAVGRRRSLPAWLWFIVGGAAIVLLLLTGILLAINARDGRATPAVDTSQPHAAQTGSGTPPTSTLAPTAEAASITTSPSGMDAGIGPGTASPEISSGVSAGGPASQATRELPTVEPTATLMPATARPPTLTMPPATPTLAPTTPRPSPTNTPRPPAAVTPCPPHLHKPKPGMGLLLIENHLGEPLHVDRVGSTAKWDLPAKQGDVPGRLLLDLPPGTYEFVDNTPRGGYGRIRVTIQPGSTFISPIWYNDRADELVYPLEIPNGCR